MSQRNIWFVALAFALLITIGSGQSSECAMEPSAWTLLTFHLDPKEEQISHTQIVVDQTGMTKLQQLADTQLSIVSIIGPYRTGKSTLLNRLLPPLAPKNVFEVGHTVQPKTEELFIYPVPPCALQGMKDSIKESIRKSNQPSPDLDRLLSVLSSVSSNTTLVLCDGPGLFSPNRAALFDAQLLAIVNLMSNVVLYNSQGVIKRSEVEQLSESVEAAVALSMFDASSADPSFAIDRPHAIWCMQNLQVELKDHNDQPLSGKAYVQHLFNEIDATAVNNSYTAKFNHFFASVDAIGLPAPTERTRDMNRINELSIDQLTPEYQMARAELISRIMSLLQPKRIGSTILNGATLHELLNQWVTNINVPTEHEKTPTSELLVNILRREIGRLMTKYRTEMDALKLPLSDHELRQAHERIVDQIKRTMPSDGQITDLVSRFSQAAETAYSQYVDQNVIAVDSFLKAQFSTFEQNWKQQFDRLRSGSSSSAEIVQAEAALVKQWQESTQNVKNANPTSVAQYQSNLVNVIKADSQPLLFDAVTRESNDLVKHCESRLSSLQLPVSEQMISQLRKECLGEWMQSQSAFGSLGAEAKSTLSESFKNALDGFQQSSALKNADAAIKRCLTTTQERGATLVSENANWMSDPRYQTRAALQAQLGTLTTLDACQNHANESQVRSEQLVFTNQLTSSLETRIFVTRALDALVFVYAMLDVFLAKSLITEAVRSSSSKNYMLLNGGTPGRTLSSRNQLVAVLGAFVAAPAYALARTVPDAASGLFGLLLDVAVLFMMLVSGIVIFKLVMRSIKGKKDKHVR